MSVTVYVGTRSATASTREFDDDVAQDGDRGRAEAGCGRRGTIPKLMPLIKAPQDYMQVDAALPERRSTSVPAERARLVKQSIDVCEKKGVVGAGYIPKTHQTDVPANSKGLFAYYQLRRGQLHPDVPHAGRRRIGLGRDDRHQGRQPDRRDRAHRDRGQQGPQESRSRARSSRGATRSSSSPAPTRGSCR